MQMFYQHSTLLVDNESIEIFSTSNPKDIPWKDLDVDIVIEATGRFTQKEKAYSHIIRSKKVIISAPHLMQKQLLLV